MTLAEYVRKIMKEKGLSLYKIAKRSEGQISHSYIQDIVSGKTKRPSAEKLKGLAKGLGENYQDLANIAGGYQREKGWTAESITQAMVKIVENEKIGEAVRALLEKSSDDIERFSRYLKRN